MLGNQELLFAIDPVFNVPAEQIAPKKKKTKKIPEPVNEFIIPEFTTTVNMKVKQSLLPKLVSSRDAVEILRRAYPTGHIDYVECFIVLALNRANTVIGYKVISIGGMTGTVADPRVILKFAMDCMACSIILSHNHPSGNLKASRQDQELTSKIKEAGRYFDIHILDHVIISSEGHFSFADDGIL